MAEGDLINPLEKKLGIQGFVGSRVQYLLKKNLFKTGEIDDSYYKNEYLKPASPFHLLFLSISEMGNNYFTPFPEFDIV